MSNSYFRFKQFIVHQQKTAMKVCTDACLFGAWAAGRIESGTFKVEHILDIGTGSGLLSLMLAQKVKAKIDAVEIDDLAAQQAEENFQGSLYAGRLQVTQKDIRVFQPVVKYDLIISNPPFYNNDLKSGNKQRNLALHSEALNFEELIASSQRMLATTGNLAVLLPFHRTNSFIEACKKYNLHLQESVFVKQTEKHSYFRSMLLFTDVETQAKTGEITLKEEGDYSEAFISLLKDYYLFL